MNRPGNRFSALVEFKGELRILDDIRARDPGHARQLLERRRKTFFRAFQVPGFQQKTYRVIALFAGTIKFANG